MKKKIKNIYRSTQGALQEHTHLFDQMRLRKKGCHSEYKGHRNDRRVAHSIEESLHTAKSTTIPTGTLYDSRLPW